MSTAMSTDISVDITHSKQDPRNVQKRVMYVQSCCFAQQAYCFFDVVVAVAVVVAKASYCVTSETRVTPARARERIG